MISSFGTNDCQINSAIHHNMVINSNASSDKYRECLHNCAQHVGVKTEVVLWQSPSWKYGLYCYTRLRERRVFSTNRPCICFCARASTDWKCNVLVGRQCLRWKIITDFACDALATSPKLHIKSLLSVSPCMSLSLAKPCFIYNALSTPLMHVTDN